MKIQFLGLCIVVLTLSLSAQDSRSFLKTPPHSDNQTPEWAAEMYRVAPDVLKVDRLYGEYYQRHAFEKSIHTQNYKHWRRQVEPYLHEDGRLLVPASKESMAHHSRVMDKKTALSQNRSAGTWRPLGPFETYSDDGDVEVSWQANVYTIDQSASDPDIVYVGTEAGGVFKSTDKGMNWFMVSAETNMRTITSIKVAPRNADIVYAGDGDAIYKTSDGGQTWSVVLVADDLRINDIAINESNENIVLAAGNKGLYRSTDAGGSWEQVMDDRVWDVEYKSDDPSVVFVLKSNEDARRQEFWKSTDGGETFFLRESGWYSSSDLERIDGGGRMAVTGADGDRIYVILVGASKPGDHGFIGVYTSYDAGESWVLNNPPVGGPYNDTHPNLATLSNTNTLQQGYYNLGIAASDSDADELLVGCLNLWRSTDGGTNYTVLGGYRGGVSWIHPDQQEIEINGSDMWVVNDGGINYSNDLFATHTSRKKGLNASDFWGLGGAWNENLIVGGRYHNGNTAHRPAFGVGNYLRLGGGEASTGYVQPGGESVAYFSDIASKVIPQSIGEAVRDAGKLALYPNESYFASNWSELVFDPHCYGHLWLGNENKLYKSEDNGNSFQVIKAFGQADDPVHNIEISHRGGEVMYVYQRTTFYGAVLWVSRDGGTSWEEKELPPADSQRSGSIAMDANNNGTLWVTFAHQLNDGNKVFRTDDYGDSWTNITEPILDGERIHCSFHQAGTDNFFVGTDYGIYIHDGVRWSDCSAGLPIRTNTNRMVPFYKENKLRVATYGNGVWEMDLPASASPIVAATVDKRTSSCGKDTFCFDDYSIVEHDASLSYQWEFTPEPLYVSSTTVRNPKVVFGTEGEFDVKLVVTNDKGTGVFDVAGFIRIEGSACLPDGAPELALTCSGGGTDFVQLPDMDMQSEAYTITAWLKPDGVQDDYTGIFFNDDDSYGLNFTSGNQLGFHHQGAGSSAWAWQSGVVVPSNEWSYVALVVEPDGATVYLNGDPTTRALNLEPVTLGTMKIGSYKGWESRNYRGLMDEVTLWDRALTTEEIRRQRHLTKMSEASGLVAYYQFNENERVYDKVGVKHGFLRGMSQLSPSSAPVGAGSASLWTDEAVVTNVFEDENISLAGSIVDGSITVSQIELAPQNLTVEGPFPENRYWIINRNGENYLEQMEILGLEIDEGYESQSDLVKLYRRKDNDSESEFSYHSDVRKVFSGQDSRIILDVNPSFSGQMILSKQELPTSTAENSEKNLVVYPNLTSSDITIKTEDRIKRIMIFDAKGQRILTREIKEAQKVELSSGLPSGSYNYVLELRDGELRTGTFIKVD